MAKLKRKMGIFVAKKALTSPPKPHILKNVGKKTKFTEQNALFAHLINTERNSTKHKETLCVNKKPLHWSSYLS
jgi:hypothetical protein